MHRTPTKNRLVALGASLMLVIAAAPAAAQASSMKHHAMKHKGMKHPSMKG
jgi:hypothetical protein